MFKFLKIILISILLLDTSFLFSETKIKTVEFKFGGYYSSTNLASGTQFNFPTRFIKLPENSKVIRSAWLEYRGLAVSAVNVNPLVIYFDPGTTATTSRFTSAQYTTRSGESIVLSARVDVTSVIASQVSNLSNGVNFTAGVRITGPTSNMHTMKLYITYEYDDASPRQVKTVRFPLYSDWTNKIASYLGAKAPGVSSMYYYADLPDLISIYQQWVEVGGFKRYINTTAGTIKVTMDGVNYEPTMYIDSSLGDSFYFRYLSSSDVMMGFSTGSLNVINIEHTNDTIYMLGGEVVITYEYDLNSQYKVNTISQFVGQSAVGTSNSVFNSRVDLGEEDILPLEIYSRINGSNGATAETGFSINSSIGGVSVSSVTYRVSSGSGLLISDFKLIYSLTQAISGFSNGAVFTSTISANTTAGGYGMELFVTYKYKNDKAHTTRYGVYSGNNTAVSTSYTYNNIPLYWVESGSSKVVNSGYTLADIISANLNGAQQTSIAYNLTNFSTITHRTINESPTMFQIYQNLSQISLSTTSFNIKYTNVSAKNSIFNGESYINYRYTPPPNPPYGLAQKRGDNNYQIPISSYVNTSTIVFYSNLSSSKTYDNLALVVELKPYSVGFDGLNLSTSSFSSFNRNLSSYVIVNLTSSTLTEGGYKWRARALGDGGSSSWVEFSSPAFYVDLTPPQPPPMTDITPSDLSSINWTTPTFMFDNGSDNLSGIRSYDLEVSTSENFSTIVASAVLNTTSTIITLNQGYYFWRVRAKDNAGNIGLWSSTKSFIIDLTLPTILDNQSGDDIWRRVNDGYYDIDFQDTGGSRLSRFQIKITTGQNQTGLVVSDWSDVITNINSD
ncbi:MAG: hypothetical protein AB1602_00555, partial [Elusimicrobiota bacterium]